MNDEKPFSLSGEINSRLLERQTKRVPITLSFGKLMHGYRWHTEARFYSFFGGNVPDVIAAGIALANLNGRGVFVIYEIRILESDR